MLSNVDVSKNEMLSSCLEIWNNLATGSIYITCSRKNSSKYWW